MVDISAIIQGGTEASTQSSVNRASFLVDQQQFLTLLVAEMENQNPLEPMSNQEFINQLTGLSSLEQLRNLSTLLQASLAYDQTNINAQSLSLIGKTVRAVDNEIEYTGTGTVTFYTEVDTPTPLTVKIYDDNGNIIRTEYLGERSGRVSYEWDGKTDTGIQAGEGNYKVVIEGPLQSGTSQQYTVFFIGHVDGVDFSNGEVILNLGGQKVNLVGVVEIMAEDEGGSGNESEPRD